MVITVVLVGLLLVSAFTDIRQHKIYNWTTYPGIIAALAISGVATWLGADVINGSEPQVETFGVSNWPDSLFGLLACGAMMIVCYVFFPGGVGGGDVKLVAMIGAFLGVMSGLEAMLWTFVIGGCSALISLVWQFGVWTLVVRSVQVAWYRLRLGSAFELNEKEREPLKTELFLAPSALLGVIIVRFQLVELLS
ncbi:MAG: prepilin peptidase [Planctomycetes bacterium]|nr:prepilin peptidase [Planctomycetota bacterium]